MLLIKNLPIKKYFKIFNYSFLIITGILLICTLTTIESSTPIISNHPQQTSSKKYTSPNASLDSKPKIESSIGIDRQYTTTQLNTTDFSFHNLTTHFANTEYLPNKFAVDSLGNIYVLGSVSNPSSSSLDIFLMKCISNGTQLWNKTWDSTGKLVINVIPDTQNFIYTVVQSSDIFNQSLGFYMSHISLVKWNPTGSIIWNKTFLIYTTTPSYSAITISITIDPLNNLYLGYPAYPTKNTNGFYFSTNTTILKFNSSSAILWNKTINASITALTTDNSNHLYLISNNGVFELDTTSGIIIWINTTISGQGIQVDNAGNIYTSSYSSIIKWSPNQTKLWSITYNNFTYLSLVNMVLDNNFTALYITSEASNGTILAKFTLNGILLWDRSIFYPSNFYGPYPTIAKTSYIYTLTPSYPHPMGYLILIWDSSGNKLKEIPWIIQPIVNLLKSITDSNGNIYSLGNSNFNININNNYAGGFLQNQVLFKYNNKGTLVWNNSWISHSSSAITQISPSNSYISNYASDIGIDSGGNVYTLGNDQYNFMIIKWSSDGASVWNFSLNNFHNPKYTSMTTVGKNIQLDTNGNIYVLSTYQSTTLTTLSYNSNINGVMLIKLNTIGQQMWNKTWTNLGNTDSYYSYPYQAYLTLLSNNHHDIYLTYASLHEMTGVSSSTNFLYLNLLHISVNGNIISNKSIFRIPSSLQTFNLYSSADIAIDNVGSLYIGYYKFIYQSNQSLPYSYIPILSETHFIKYDSNGDQIWNKTFFHPSNLLTVPTAIVVDNAGFVYSLVLNLPMTNNSQTLTTILNVMNADGNQVWNQSFTHVFGTNIYVDSNGKILITGMLINNYSIYTSVQYNGQIFLLSNHSLVNENVNTGDPLTAVTNFIKDNLVVISIFFIIGILGGSISMIYLNSHSLNVTSKRLNLFGKKSQDTNSYSNQQRTGSIFSKKSSSQTPDTSAVNIIEQILIENYQAPDYVTALKVQQGGFPDYATYKQALEKGIATYKDWERKNP